MKKLLLLSILLSACEPVMVPADGLDAATDASVVSDASPETASDALPPHVDGGGID